VKKGFSEAFVGGLVMKKGAIYQVGRKYHLSLAQLQALKDIKNGKQAIIVRALGVGKALVKSLK
jgi:hypothetical protein